MASSSTPNPVCWSAIALTCQDRRSADAFRKELEIHQQKGFIDKSTLILTIEDPKSRVGSGGATLNALLVVTEHLSAKEGFTTVDSSVIKKSRILIMHVGRDYPFSTCGPVFTTLPAKHYNSQSVVPLADCLVANFDCLLFYLTHRICHGSPNGVWVCSTDMMLSIPSYTEIKWNSISQDIVMLLFESSVEKALQHGACQLDDEGNVKNIIFKGTREEVQSCALDNGNVPLVGSIVFFNFKAADKLLMLHSYPPLDACTYYGLDNGAKPIQISLFFDLLLSMATGVSRKDFVSGKESGAYGKSTRVGVKKMTDNDKAAMHSAWEILWKHLRGMKVHGVVMGGDCEYNYMHPTGMAYRVQLKKCLEFFENANLPYVASSHMHVYNNSAQSISNDAVVINSIITGSVKVQEESVIAHCYLKGNLTIGTGCVMSGIGTHDLKGVSGVLPDYLCLLGYNISLPGFMSKTVKVFAVFGVNDHLEIQLSCDEYGQFCNTPWEEFFKRTGLTSDDLWVHGLPEDKRTLFNARLFPVAHPNMCDSTSLIVDCFWLAGIDTGLCNETMKRRWHNSWRLSLKDIMASVEPGIEFEWRRQLFFQIGQYQVEGALEGGTNTCFLPFLKACAVEGHHNAILAAMDRVACSSNSSSSMGVAARTLACIADVLGAMAGENAGLRSGPAQNEAWNGAFQLLKEQRIAEGVKALAAERTKWMDRPDLLIRAARHYEGAEQILRRHVVMTAQQFMHFKNIACPPMSHWVIAEAPARIDLSGGWSDTPPIAYEHGGVVVNVAIQLNGKKPLKVRARRIAEPHIELVILAGTSHHIRVVCKQHNDLADYSQPSAPGALVKACFCAVKLVDIDDPMPLPEQLMKRYGGGFQVESMADVPYGSGLGTSSILSGVVLAAILHAAGKETDVTSIVHAVMVVEQMLTCGGGWQDNVGGLVPGFKIAMSSPSLPLQVSYEKIQVPCTLVNKLKECLVFVYTGKTRLAKNLLQNVVRNWYGRDPSIVKVVDDLVKNAKDMSIELQKGDLVGLGKCLGYYRKQKRLIAPGTEPETIRHMMDAVEPYVHGQCLAGAGGGGFLCIVAKSGDDAAKVKHTLQTQFPNDVELYDVSIDNDGLTIKVEEP